jgi:class 3 adenylate cyclase
MSIEGKKMNNIQVTHERDPSKYNEYDNLASDPLRANLYKKKTFQSDQDLLIETHGNFIAINDTNAHTPTPKFQSNLLHPLGGIKTEQDYEVLALKSSEGKRDSSFIADLSLMKTNLSQVDGDTTSPHKIDAPEANPDLDRSPDKGDHDTSFIDVFKEEDASEEKRKAKTLPKWKKRIIKLLDTAWFNIVVGIFTIYTLFGDDIRTVAFNRYADMVFDVLSLIAMAIFVLEICLNLCVKKDYFCSFFFWLDIISTISIILDVKFLSEDLFPSSAANTAQLARASRASRIGTKAGRVVRIVRLVRLAKLYKQVNQAQQEKEEGIRRLSTQKIYPGERSPTKMKQLSLMPQNVDSLKSQQTSESPRKLRKGESKILPFATPNGPSSDELNLKESRVGKKLSDLTTKRLIIIVLLLLFCVPLFDSNFYNDDPTSNPYQVSLLGKMYDTATIPTNVSDYMRDYYINLLSVKSSPLIYVQITGTQFVWSSGVDLDALRDEEKTETTYDTTTVGTITGITSSRSTTVLESWLNIGRTFFICCVLTFGAMFFSKDANDLVLRPIERMIQKVNRIAKNPMAAKEERIVRDATAGAHNETIDIENAIIKIGGLLALGFGDAGSEIVAQNIAMSGDINPMLPGKKKLAIFGFCDIRNFTDATEVLQEDVMIFVNSIGGVVHSVIDAFGGSANKNIGDAFLLVWKIPETELEYPKSGALQLRNTRLVHNYADFSLISFLKICAKINRNPILLAYRNNAKLKDRLPNYQVRMGFGLHVGWAIEGAIGSHFKIDASYLSPNVNMASRFEAATKQYGVPLLFSGELFSLLSPETKEKCRLIDIITVKGSIKPVEIYTVDIDFEDFTPSKTRSDYTAEEKRLRQKYKKDKNQSILKEGEASSLWETDQELLHLTRNHNPEFYQKFRLGFDGYVKGNWQIAKTQFETCLELDPNDGPTKTLLNYLKECNYKAPEDWTGYRILTEK